MAKFTVCWINIIVTIISDYLMFAAFDCNKYVNIESTGDVVYFYMKIIEQKHYKPYIKFLLFAQSRRKNVGKWLWSTQSNWFWVLWIWPFLNISNKASGILLKYDIDGLVTKRYLWN